MPTYRCKNPLLSSLSPFIGGKFMDTSALQIHYRFSLSAFQLYKYLAILRLLFTIGSLSDTAPTNTLVVDQTLLTVLG
jgi:hypothetical protein